MALPKVRAVASLMLLLSMAGTFVAALILKSSLLTLGCSVVQYFALIWYSLSYIPYARDLVAKVLRLFWTRSYADLS